LFFGFSCDLISERTDNLDHTFTEVFDMARLARAEVFDPGEVTVLHVCARVVRRCFLFGTDPFTKEGARHLPFFRTGAWLLLLLPSSTPL